MDTPVDRRVLFHVGWPKTATTSLQRQLRVYPNLAGKPFSRDGGDHAVAVIHNLSTATDWSSEALEDLLQRSWHDTSLPVVLSDEGLIAMPQRVWFEGLVSPEERALRLSQTSWNGHVLMTMREPVSHLRSTWMHWIREGFTLDYEDFLNRVTKDRAEGTGTFAVAALVEKYGSLFGSRNVIVADYEAYIAQPSRFWRQLSLVMNVGRFADLHTGDLPRLNSMQLGPLRAELALNSTFQWYRDSFGGRGSVRLRRFVNRNVSTRFTSRHDKYFARYESIETGLAAAIALEMDAVKKWTTRIGT